LNVCQRDSRLNHSLVEDPFRSFSFPPLLLPHLVRLEEVSLIE
jgi:hypothetical protein